MATVTKLDCDDAVSPAAYRSFESAVRAIPERGPFKAAVVDVLDTARIAAKWFAAYAPDATADDIVGMTALILERARQIRKETAERAVESE